MMQFNRFNRFIRLAMCLVVFSALATTTAAEEKQTAPPQKSYESPEAVFQAYRAAMNSRDTRTVFSCRTAALNSDEVYQTCIELFMTVGDGGPKSEVSITAAALLKKYGLDDSALDVEYYKRYLKKHGVDLQKLHAEHDANVKKARADYYKTHEKPPAPAADAQLVAVPEEEAIATDKIGPKLPPEDMDLLKESICSQIADPVEFCAAVAAEGPTPRVADLQELRIEGDKATGHIVTHGNVEIIERTGADLKDIHRTVTVEGKTTYHFHKTEKGWLIENIVEGDDGPAKPIVVPASRYVAPTSR